MKKGFISALFLLVALALGYQAPAQGYRIEATLAGLKDTTCILGHYNYSNQQFLAKDTARVNAKGQMVFEGSQNLPGGLYLILLPGNQRWVEVVYSGEETRFSLKTDTSAIVTSMVVAGSGENQLFYNYQKEIRSTMREIEALNTDKQKNKDAVTASLIDNKLTAAQDKFSAYRKKFLADNATTFTAKLLRSSIEPEIPEAPTLANGKKDSLWVFNYYKAHYWDNFDLTDPRLLKAPFIQPKLERYIKSLVVQVADSITKDVDMLVQKTGGNKELKSYIIYYVTSEYENPKVVGTEAVFVHMAEKYYLTGQMEVSEDAKKRIRERVNSMKPVLVDKIIPDLVLSDLNRKPISIHGIKSDYTVVFFYSPTCGHCKESAPILKEFYEKNKNKGLKVLAVATEQGPEEWKKYVQEFKLEELLHGYDFTQQTDYRLKFDVFATPTVYVLDKNKKIIARRMPVEQLDDFYNFYLKNHPPAEVKSAAVGKTEK